MDDDLVLAEGLQSADRQHVSEQDVHEKSERGNQGNAAPDEQPVIPGRFPPGHRGSLRLDSVPYAASGTALAPGKSLTQPSEHHEVGVEATRSLHRPRFGYFAKPS